MKFIERPAGRFITREVKVGSIGIGGNNPIRIQSMTTSTTRDVEGTIEQVIRLAEAGCDLVRVTVQGMKEAESCEHIKNGLMQRGVHIPMVADIHFYPPAAMRVVDFVDKVRINPGNFVDKRAQFKLIEYDEITYLAELNKIAEEFTPLVEKCKRLKKAIRIGTNHGSLSDRIMNRYGDTAEGMVESALEFARVARDLDFHDLIFSMKASNPKVMIQAYRMLVQTQVELGWNYPLHLGVTEAGEGEDGRVKSAVGIGTLLLEGIGDTLRVSLTEDPWQEVEPCRQLVQYASSSAKLAKPISHPSRQIHFASGLHPQGSVFLKVSESEILDEGFYEQLGCTDQWGSIKKSSTSPEGLLIEDKLSNAAIEKIKAIRKAGICIVSPQRASWVDIPLYTDQAPPLVTAPYALKLTDLISKPSLTIPPVCFFIELDHQRIDLVHSFHDYLDTHKNYSPIILAFAYRGQKEEMLIQASMECGALCIDGMAQGLCIDSSMNISDRLAVSFSILQASRIRSVKTEFISCPGCGRTLFQLQEVSKRIKEKTSHLPGLKIAIMGCIVNGPGEMADADFGYVGSRPGKIDLYIGKNCVEKNIDISEAEERLIDLIKKQGLWIDK